MGERLIKPYEISVWEEKLIPDGTGGYTFSENKLAVIGSDTMTGLNKVYDPVFHKKTNGEKSLTFSLKYRYFDPYSSEEVENPFAAYLVNERKVKLKYGTDDNGQPQWYEFIIKDHSESSEEFTWTYSCTDAYVLELSKQGYNITFDSELGNNQGTAEYLANETLKNTDWKLKEVNVGRQLIAEPIYMGIVRNAFDALNTDTGQVEEITVTSGTESDVYVFYSYIKNKDGKFLQFIKRSLNDVYEIDSKNVITATNYRILEDIIFDDTTIKIIRNNNGSLQTTLIIDLLQPETRYQANRLAYGKRTVYDKVMDKTVDLLKAGDREIYKYTDYIYTTSDVVMNYFTNGDNFNILDDGSLQGWNPYTDSTDKVKKLELVTKPILETNKPLANLNLLSQTEGFLKVRFNGPKTVNNGQIYNTVYNSGVEDASSFIQSVSNGEKFVFRWRAGVRNPNESNRAVSDVDCLVPNTSLRMMVAKYDQDTPTAGYYYKHIKPEDVILDFTGNVTIDNIFNNYITGGTISDTYRLTYDKRIIANKKYYTRTGTEETYVYAEIAQPSVENLSEYYEKYHQYIIGTVVQTPSTKYIYVDNSGGTKQEYVWNNSIGDFELLDNNTWSNYLPYYYLTATVTKSISNKDLTDADANYGIFIYTIDNAATESAIVSREFESEYIEETKEDVYDTYQNENIDPITGTTISVSYINAESQTPHTYTFTAGTSQKEANSACRYDATTNNISFIDGAGIVSYTIEYTTVKAVYIQDVQFTRFIADGEGKPILVGNVPVADSSPIDYYYLKPEDGTAAEDVETYVSLSELANKIGVDESNIELQYNSEKNLTISAAQSNCFNILQTIAETFECWVQLEIDHDENGYITYDNQGRPNKFVLLNEYIGKANFTGFKYGTNLQSIERTINSDEVVTKLIVDQSQSDLVDEGYISIANAPSNVSGESYILNFDYYYSQGLLDRETTEADKFDFIREIALTNAEIKELEKQRRDLENSMLHLDSQRTDYTLLIEGAQDTKTESLQDFEDLTGKTYDEYNDEHERIINQQTQVDSFTASDPIDTKNQFVLLDFPAANTNFTVDVEDWSFNTTFTSGKRKVVSYGAQDKEILIGKSLGIEGQLNKTYEITFGSIEEKVKGPELVETYEQNNDNEKTVVWRISSLIDSTLWDEVSNGEEFSILLGGILHAINEENSPVEKNILIEPWKFKKGQTSVQTGKNEVTTISYNAIEETITYTYKIVSTGRTDGVPRYIQQLTGQLILYVTNIATILKGTTISVIGTNELIQANNDWIIELEIGTDTSGTLTGFSYNYNGSTNVLRFTAQQLINIDKITYQTNEASIIYDGRKTLQFKGMPLGTGLVSVTYIPSINNQLTDEATILDLLGKLYSSSATINNYSGLLTNIEQEYWNVRKQLKGSENYRVTVSANYDINDRRHIYVEGSDYIPGLTFTLSSGGSGIFSLSQKYFEFETDANIETSITFNSQNIEGTYYFDGTESLSQTTSFIVTDSPIITKVITTDGIDGIEDQINDLLKRKEELTIEFNNKYSRYILEGTWNSTEYIDAEHYYLDALQVSNTSAQPTVNYTINVVEISELEGYEGYLFDTGDKSFVEDTEFFGWEDINIGTAQNPTYIRTPVREEVIVSEVEWHLEEPDQNTITVQNYKTRFEDLFQRISATVQTVQFNEASYTKTSTLLDSANTLDQQLLIDSLNSISGKRYNLTSNGSVVIDGDQILVQNLNNLANRVIINSEGIQVSSDGGKTWKTVLSGRGINLGAVYMGSLDTDSIIIGGERNPSFRWDRSGISAYKIGENGISDLHTYVRYDQYGLYGIKNDTFKANSLQDVLDKAYFGVTWDGFFIKNSYEGGGQVSITSENDFQVLKAGGIEKIKIGALEWNSWLGGITTDPADAVGAPILYGIRIRNDLGQDVFKTTDEGNIEITGTINALGGNFTGVVNVGPISSTQNRIIIDGTDASIRTSNYASGATQGWMIRGNGDADFMNITARGAIRTAVFEYAEIQAVGGVFIFRPSSTIKGARIAANEQDLILKVEKPLLFAKISYTLVDNLTGNPQTQGWYERTNYGYQLTTDTSIILDKEYFIKDDITNGSWCKISNYTSDGVPADSTIQNILLNNGLTHVYKVINVNTETKELTLQGAAAMVSGNSAITTLKDLEGGALIDMGREDGSANYGIGVNSSDNTVNLPARAITLFETVINPNPNPETNIKVSYNYRGVLGTLPDLPANQVRQSIYPRYMVGQQGIYTDNMYIGDGNEYLAFYTDTDDLDEYNQPKKKLKISTHRIVFAYDPNTNDEIYLDDHINDHISEQVEEQVPVRVEIESNIGNEFIRTGEVATLTCSVYRGVTDITNQITQFVWTKKLSDGTSDTTWNTAHANINSNTITVLPSDINVKAIFECNVTF